MINKKLLRSKMALYGDTNETLAEALDVTPQTVSNKINESNGAEFVQSEIRVIKYRYNLSLEEVDAIFFADNVSCEDTERS